MINPSMPELPYLLDAGGDSVLSYPYLRSFESTRRDPFVVLHTSGSTGTPKPVVISHGMMAAMDAYQMIPHLGGNPTYGDFYRGTRLFLGFPLFHAASVCCLFGLSVYYNFTCVLPPPVPLTAEVTDLVHIHGDVQGSAVPPSIIVDLAQDPAQLERMSHLKHITYGGGPLPKETGDAVVSKTRILSFMGSTETGLFPIEISDRDDWEHLCYSSYLGHEFRPFKDYEDLYEFVIIRNDEYDAFQGVFSTFPDMNEYSTGDLYSKHPKKQGYWRSCGRRDDIIAFSNGEKLNPVTIEGVVSAHPAIEHALVNGHGRFQTSLLLKSRMPLSEYDKDTLLDDIWPTVQRANQDCPTHGRVMKHLIMFAVPEKPMVKTAKNTVKRKETLQLYQDEFDALYAAASCCSTSLEPIAFDIDCAESLRNTLRHLISTNTTVADVTDTADLFQQGLDSLQVMTLTKAVNVFFTNSWPGFRQISSKVIYANPTISKLESAVRKSTASESGSSTKNHEYEMEGYLSRFASSLPYEAMSDRREVVLLTGSTGSLGSYLLGTFISDPEVAKVYCLNRAHNGFERQKKSFEDKGLTSNFEKVEFLHCNISEELFGLDLSKYLKLRGSVTQVVHNAWEVNFNLSVSSFKPHISGICQLIRFCLNSAREPFIFFISSLESVRGWSKRHAGKVPEMILTDWSVCGDTGYAESKMLAERLLDTSKAGVRSVICRVGQIAGPVTEKGIWSKQEWLPSIIASSMYLGRIPNSLGTMDPIDWIPVDSLSLMIKDLIRTTTNKRLLLPNFVDGLQSIHNRDHNLTSPRVYHLSNPFATSWSSLLPSVLAAAPGLKTVSLSNWVDALRQSTSQGNDLQANPAAKLLSFFEDLQSQASCGAMPVVLDNRNTIMDCPSLMYIGPINAQMMDNWMRQWAFQR